MSKTLFTIASVYLALIGLSLLIVPAQFGVDAVPDDPSSELLALLRLLGGPLVGISVMDWMARNIEPSTIRNTVLLGNVVGFGLVALNDVVGVSTGDARDLAAIFLVIHLALAISFVVVWVRAGDHAAPAGAH